MSRSVNEPYSAADFDREILVVEAGGRALGVAMHRDLTAGAKSERS